MSARNTSSSVGPAQREVVDADAGLVEPAHRLDDRAARAGAPAARTSRPVDAAAARRTSARAPATAARRRARVGEVDLEALAADAVLELVGRALGDHAAVVDHRDRGRPGGRPRRGTGWSAARSCPRRRAPRSSSHSSRRLRGSRPVVGSSRNSTGGLGDERRGEVEPAAHAARVGLGGAVGRRRPGRSARAAPRRARLGGARGARRRGGRPSTRFSRPVRFSSTAAYWPGEADPLAQLGGVADDVEAGHARGAGVGLEQRGEHAHRASSCPRRWGRAARARVPGGGVEVDAVERAHVAERLHEAGHADRRLARVHAVHDRHATKGLGQILSSIAGMLARVSETATSGRLLKLLSLLQARRDWPGEELADRLEVSGRTIRRDIERLRELGYPVESLTGPAGGYRLRAGTAMPPLLLDDDEAIAIAVGLRTAARASVTGIEETSVRALVKLEQVLPAHLRRRVNALQARDGRRLAGGGPTVDPEALTAIAARLPRPRAPALRLPRPRRRPRAAARSSRTSLVNLGRRWYLVAWDCEREDWRTFRVDRLERPPAAGARFAPRELPGAGRRPPTWRRTSSGAPVALRGARHAARPADDDAPSASLFAGATVEPIDERHVRAAHQRRRPGLAGGARGDARRRLRGPRAARARRARARAGGPIRARGETAGAGSCRGSLSPRRARLVAGRWSGRHGGQSGGGRVLSPDTASDSAGSV